MISIQTIETIHDFDHCKARHFWIRAYRVNVIRAIIIIDRHCNQKKLLENKKIIKTIHNKKMLINVKFFDFDFHMKTNIDQIQNLINLKIYFEIDWHCIHCKSQILLNVSVHKIDFNFKIHQCQNSNAIFQICSYTKICAWISKIDVFIIYVNFQISNLKFKRLFFEQFFREQFVRSKNINYQFFQI